MDRLKKFNIILSIMFLLSISMVFAEDIIDTDRHSYISNNFIDDDNNMVGFLIPAILLTITLITFAIDFGTVGVSLASITSMILLYFLHIIYLNPINLTSLVIIIGIMIYKMQG